MVYQIITLYSNDFGNKTLQIFSDDAVKTNNDALAKTAELQNLLIEHYKNGRPINVTIKKDDKNPI